MLKCDVAVVGCGLGGVAAALVIQRAGHQVTIYEKADGLHQVGAGIQHPYNCTRILNKWGILSIIESLAVRPSNVVLRRYEDGRVLFRRTLPPLKVESGEDLPHLLIHRAELMKMLVGQAVRLGVLLRFCSTVTKIDFEKPAIQFSNKETRSFDVIFGADGFNSICRRLLFGDINSPRFSGDAAYRLLIPVTDIERDEELSHLLQDSDISCWIGPSGHAVCYRLKEGSLLNVVLVGPDKAHRRASDPAQSDEQDIRTLFQDRDPRLQKMFRLAKKVLKSRLNDSHELASWSHPNGKSSLVGDACHASLPYLAQGAAQALEDAGVLGYLFAKIEQKDQIEEIIQMYQAARKPRTSRVIAGSEERGSVYHLPDGKAQQDRDRELTHACRPDRYPSCIEDLAFQSWLLQYDIDPAAEQVWKQNQDCCI